MGEEWPRAGYLNKTQQTEPNNIMQTPGIAQLNNYPLGAGHCTAIAYDRNGYSAYWNTETYTWEPGLP